MAAGRLKIGSKLDNSLHTLLFSDGPAPRYSVEIDKAFIIVNELVKRGNAVALVNEGSTWLFYIGREEDSHICAKGRNIPEAICFATARFLNAT